MDELPDPTTPPFLCRVREQDREFRQPAEVHAGGEDNGQRAAGSMEQFENFTDSTLTSAEYTGIKKAN